MRRSPSSWLRAAVLPAALLLASPLALAHGTEPCDEAGCLVGKPAPEITTPDWIRSDGRTRLAEFRGEVVLLESWATW